MKLQSPRTESLNTFPAYGDDHVVVNGIRHSCNLVVLPDRLLPEWTRASFETLSITDFELLAGLGADIVLLGTGKRLRFPRPELLQPLIRAQRGLEVMDLAAACRTYNVLVGEGRRVAAGLLIA